MCERGGPRLGDEIPIEVLRQTPSKLRVIIEGRADEVLSRPEAPGRWSAVEIIQHLVDSEVAWAWRFRLVLSQDRPVLTGYDQDAWSALFKYRDAKVEATSWEAAFSPGRQAEVV